ncbi:MAG: hypothetical protein AAF216_07205 [Pseudomonadota bacterium]
MGFREKSAWIMAVALTLTGGFYGYVVTQQTMLLGHPPPPNIGLAVVVTIPLVALAIFGHAFAALGNPTDANSPQDERDRVIAWRAGNLAGLLFGVITIAAISAYAVLEYGDLLFHLVVFGLVVSQLADYILTILFYRRGQA